MGRFIAMTTRHIDAGKRWEPSPVIFITAVKPTCQKAISALSPRKLCGNSSPLCGPHWEPQPVAGLLLLADRGIQRAEAAVAVGLERAHAEFLGQGEGFTVVGLG